MDKLDSLKQQQAIINQKIADAEKGAAQTKAFFLELKSIPVKKEARLASFGTALRDSRRKDGCRLLTAAGFKAYTFDRPTGSWLFKSDSRPGISVSVRDAAFSVNEYGKQVKKDVNIDYVSSWLQSLKN